MVAPTAIPAPARSAVLGLSLEYRERCVYVCADAKRGCGGRAMGENATQQAVGFGHGSRLTTERNLRTAPTGKRASRGRVGPWRPGRTNCDAGRASPLSLGVAHGTYPGHRSSPRDGQAAYEGAHASADPSSATGARQLSVCVLFRTRRHRRSRRSEKSRRGTQLDQRSGGLPTTQHPQGRSAFGRTGLAPPL